MNTVTIIQARMSSTRLPGKILKQINGISILEYSVLRSKWSSLSKSVVITTSSEKEDDIVIKYCEEKKWDYFRGDLNDVLKRYYDTAIHKKAEIIVRLTADCPLIDGQLIDEALTLFKSSNLDYVSNTITRTYPRGFDVEVFSFKALKDAHQNATLIEDREHVTPFIWKNKGNRFKIKQLVQNEDNSKYRITLDTIEDLEVIKTLIEKYNAANLRYNEIIDILQAHPEISLINKHIEQKKV